MELLLLLTTTADAAVAGDDAGETAAATPPSCAAARSRSVDKHRKTAHRKRCSGGDAAPLADARVRLIDRPPGSGDRERVCDEEEVADLVIENDDDDDARRGGDRA